MPARIPTQRLLLELQYVQKQAGRPPSPEDFDKYSEFGKGVITSRFATWPAARFAAGLRREIDSWERKKADESTLLDELRELAREVGKIPAASDMDQFGDRSSTTYQRRFGTWEHARQAAGFQEPNPYKIQSDTLLQQMREFAEEIGHTPSQTEMKAKGPHSAQVYHNRFGTYGEAVRAAGLEPNRYTESVTVAGSSSLYGGDWRKRRLEALERDEYSCRHCGISQEEHLKEHGRQLHVHHIRPSRTFEKRKEAHALDNLLVLCQSCHGSCEAN